LPDYTQHGHAGIDHQQGKCKREQSDQPRGGGRTLLEEGRRGVIHDPDASNGHGRRVTVNVKVNGLPATDWVWRWCGAQALGGRSTVHLRETHLSGPRRRLA